MERTTETKQCGTCKKTLTLGHFHRRSDGQKGVRSDCKECCKAKNKARYHTSYKYTHARKMTLLRNRCKSYGISICDFQGMFLGQGARCAICKSKFGNKMPNIDHCHTTGKVRGLLCSDCNRGLGAFKDNRISLEAAIYYLEE